MKEGESCQRTINVEPLPKAFGRYLKKEKLYIIKINFVLFVSQYRYLKGAHDIKQAWGRCPCSGIMYFLNSLNSILISLFIESFYF